MISKSIINKKIKEVTNILVKKFKQIRDSKEDPHYIAIGMAIGIFIAITPTIPFHTVLALMLATLVRGSKVAAVLGVWFSNPITITPLYFASYKIGALITGNEKLFDISGKISFFEMLRVGVDITFTILIGGIILAIIPSILVYFVTRWFLSFINRNK